MTTKKYEFFSSPNDRVRLFRISPLLGRKGWTICQTYLFSICLSFLISDPSAFSKGFGDYELAPTPTAFVTEIPFYCPPPSVQDVQEIIKEECTHSKEAPHYIFKDEDFAYGQEPYRIANDDFRGFLKLSATATSDTPLILHNKHLNPRKYEGAKPLEKSKSPLSAFLEKETGKDAAAINAYVQLFQSETFGKTPEESLSRFHDSVRVVLLLNRYKSISSTRNASLKYFSESLTQTPNVLILRGFWEPKWVKGQSGVPVSFQEVRHFFLEYLNRKPEDALKFLIENEGGEIDHMPRGRLQGLIPNGYGLNTHVPYQELREALRIHPIKKLMVTELLGADPKRAVYEAIHDSDLVHLRTKNSPMGLYSHYEKLIAEQHPDMVTTGYSAAFDDRFKEDENYFKCLSVAIDEDRYVRAALARVDPRLTYYPEPNLIIRVDQETQIQPYSFLKNIASWSLSSKAYSFEAYNPQESLNALKHLYEQSKSKPVVIFDPTHPVEMRLPQRMLNNKHTGTRLEVGCYDPSQSKIAVGRRTYKFLKVSENLSQSSLSFRDYAVVIYTELGLKGKSHYITSAPTPIKVTHPNAVFTSIVSSIFNSYDPVQLIENLPTEQPDPLRYVCENYTLLADVSHVMFKADLADDNVNAVLMGINKLTNKSDQLKVLSETFNPVFKVHYLDQLMDTIIQAAKSMGEKRSKVFLSSYYYTTDPIAAISSPGLDKMLKLKKEMGTWKKVAETLGLSPPRVSEYINGKATAGCRQAIEKAISAYEKTLSSTGG